MKTSEQALEEAERVLEKAEAERADPDFARELVAVAHAWITLADRLEERERKTRRPPIAAV